MMEFWGELETHITVTVRDLARLDALAEWGASRGLKIIHILLERGDHPSQPMLTRRRRGGLSEELAAARDLSRELEAAGFPVCRIKIEAAPWNADVPRVRCDAPESQPRRYFEHHVKLLLRPGLDMSALTRRAEQHAAHLSRNALRQDPAGEQERFVTQRCYSTTRQEARQRLDALLEAIAPLGHPVLDVEEEYVVYDNNMAFDAGWLPEDR